MRRNCTGYEELRPTTRELGHVGGNHDANFRCMATARRILIDDLGMDVYFFTYKMSHGHGHTTAGFLGEQRTELGLKPLDRQHEPRIVLAFKRGLVSKKVIKEWMWEHRLAWNVGNFHKER